METPEWQKALTRAPFCKTCNVEVDLVEDSGYFQCPECKELNSEIWKVKIGGIFFNEDCPEKCPGHEEHFSQGGLCHRCPIFNCVGEVRLLEPEEYRKGWAEAWKIWFDNGMKDFPELYF